jgi:hypothetical protein
LLAARSASGLTSPRAGCIAAACSPGSITAIGTDPHFAPGQDADERGANPLRVWSIGHSTHPFPDFLELLRRNRIEAVADIRRFPNSRKHPQFGIDALRAELPAHGLRYRHLPQLGGRRAPREDSPNHGWRNRSFRGYADHAMSAEFALGLAALRELAERGPTAMMCAEAVWWRCHRRLVADRLVADGAVVLHIAADGRCRPHELTPFARRDDDGGAILYPAQPGTAAQSG